MSLDAKTIIMMNIVGTLLMSLSLFIVSRGYLGQIKGFTKWAVATLIQSLGWIILSVLRDKVPDIISVVFGNGLILLCLGLYFNILAEFNNQKIRRGWIYLLVGLEACLLAYFVLITPHVSARIAIISGLSSLLMFSSSYILFFKSQNRPASNLLTAAMFTICGIILATRCFYSVFVAPAPAQLPFGDYPMQNISYLTFYITSIMLTFGFVLMCNDRYINDHKLLEDALAESEEKFRKLLETAPDAMVIVDSKGEIKLINLQTEKIFGYTKDELLGNAVELLIPSHNIKGHRSHSDHFFAHPQTRTMGVGLNLSGKHKNGTEIPIEISSSPLKTADGIWVSAAIRDISERKKAEEKLIKNEKQLNDAQQLAKIGSWEFNLITFDLTWSIEHYRIFELEDTPPDKLYDAYRSKIHPDDIKMLDTVVNNAIELGEGFNYEHRVICNNGTIKYVIGIGRTIKDEQGKPIELRGTVQDITQRKKTEEILRLSELRYRTLAEASEDIIYIISPKGKIDYLNDFAVRQFGKASDALVGKQMVDLFSSEIAERQWEYIQKIFKSGQSAYVEDHTILGGDLKFLGTNLVALKDSSGNITSVMGVARDITERINAENILKKNESFITNIIENIPIAVFAKNAADLRYIRINKAGEELIGFSKNELINKNDYEIFSKPEADFFTSKDREALKSNQLIDIPEQIIQTKFLGKRTVHVQKISILDINGKPDYILGIALDITEKKRIEQDLIIAKGQAEHLAHSKDRFLSNMSHEIRTPLNGIIGFTNVLLQSKLPSKQKQQIEIIKTSGNILLVLINDILDLAKINDGKMILEASEFKLSDLVNGIIATFKLSADEKKLKLLSHVDKSIPNILIGDPIRISQILINLINNSIKFTNNGGQINVDVNLVEQNQEKAILEFSISDTGIGIPKEKLATIFEPFIQGDNTISQKYGGTGLGLRACLNFC